MELYLSLLTNHAFLTLASLGSCTWSFQTLRKSPGRSSLEARRAHTDMPEPGEGPMLLCGGPRPLWTPNNPSGRRIDTGLRIDEATTISYWVSVPSFTRCSISVLVPEWQIVRFACS